ncbi:MAG: methyltransferase [Gemmataceae bacterium]
MSRHRATPELPACYAMVIPGLEPIAAQEIEEDLGGTIKKSDRGLVVFRVPEINRRLLRLRTVEDVFLLAWGSDQLTYRAQDLKSIRHWTAQEVDWQELLRLHHDIRPKPKGKPTYRLVAQMTGQHVYRRVDARTALAQGLAGKLPASWKHAEENAAVEIWLTIHGATAVCGLRLSDRTMRHRTYKVEHLPASLRPTLAAALVRLAGAQAGQVVVDPFCGAGTILAEQWDDARRRGQFPLTLLGGDLEITALRAARSNLRQRVEPLLVRWDARRLPLASRSVERIISNPPFGKQLSSPEEIGPLYREAVREMNRILRPEGKAVLLVGELPPLREAARAVGWKLSRQLRVQVLGQAAALTVWQKLEKGDRIK